MSLHKGTSLPMSYPFPDRMSSPFSFLSQLNVISSGDLTSLKPHIPFIRDLTTLVKGRFIKTFFQDSAVPEDEFELANKEIEGRKRQKGKEG